MQIFVQEDVYNSFGCEKGNKSKKNSKISVTKKEIMQICVQQLGA